MSALKDKPTSFGWKRWLWLGAQIVLMLCCAGAGLGLYVVSHTLDTGAAERFRGESDTSFAQIAAFMPVGGGKSEEDILAFRETLENKFIEQALEAPENGSLYVDAYSGRSDVTITSDHGSAAVTAFGVGGDFFYFHPLTLRSGAYIAERDLMDDLVVLDEVLAWRLFGGTELAGLTVQIGGVPFVVSGVVAMEDDFASSAAYGGEGCLFVSFSAMKSWTRMPSLTAMRSYCQIPSPATAEAWWRRPLTGRAATWWKTAAATPSAASCRWRRISVTAPCGQAA